MSSDIQPYILDELDAVIEQTVANIGLYTKNPSDFTRNRKLNAKTTIKVTLNMQGNIVSRHRATLILMTLFRTAALYFYF